MVMATGLRYSNAAISSGFKSDIVWLQLSYTGVPAVSRAGCFIGVYSPANVSVSAIAPIPFPATAPWTETASIK